MTTKNYRDTMLLTVVDSFSPADCLYVNQYDFQVATMHAKVKDHVFMIETHKSIPPSCIGMSALQRRSLLVSLDEVVELKQLIQ